MVGIIKAFRIIRKNRKEFNRWVSINPVKFFTILIVGMSIWYILFRVIIPNIAGIIIAFLGGLFWAILWLYLLCLYVIKELNLTL
jgi:ABC-type dipeptide/oligopeptide/nickel transport system permease subunit